MLIQRMFRLQSSIALLLLLSLLLYSGFSEQNPVQQQQQSSSPSESSTSSLNSAVQLSRLNDVEIVDNLESRAQYYQPNNIIVNNNNNNNNHNNEPDDRNLPEHFDERRRDIPAGNGSDCVKQVLIVDTSVINNSANPINRRVPVANSHVKQQLPPQSKPVQIPVSHQAVQSGQQLPPIYIQTVPQNPSQSNQPHQIPVDVSHSISSTNHSTTIQVQINSSSTTSTTTIQPQRPNVLMPKLESSGRPACVESPDDTFCEIVDNYPKAAIKSEINFSPEQFGEIFGSKEIDGRKSYSDDDMGEEGVCRKFPKVIYPQMAKNQANQWVYVVNEVEYTQAVVAEVCEKQGKACAYLDQNLPPGMYSRCKQKYSYKRLLALHPTERRTYPDAFKFPSCCSCYVKFDDFARSGLGRKLQSPAQVVDTNKRKSQNTQNRDSRSNSSSSVSSAGGTSYRRHESNDNDETTVIPIRQQSNNYSPTNVGLSSQSRNRDAIPTVTIISVSPQQQYRNQTFTRKRHRTSSQPSFLDASITPTTTAFSTRSNTRTNRNDP